MFQKKESDIVEFQGDEGTKIRQYFDPGNTGGKINYSLAQFTLEPEKKSRLHKIRSSEIYYILEGQGEITIDNIIFKLAKNDSIFVPPSAKQFIRNTGKADLKFLCIVYPPWKKEDENILE